ncbi:MAG: EAL domain-containing protein [Sphaerobacter sp.]|nr:EAL domain-containing protein [Sphaerobacter sp.]
MNAAQRMVQSLHQAPATRPATVPADWSRPARRVVRAVTSLLAVALGLVALLVPGDGGVIPPALGLLGAAGLVARWLRGPDGARPAPAWGVLEAASVVLLAATSGGAVAATRLLALGLVGAGLCYRALVAPWRHLLPAVFVYAAGYLAGAWLAAWADLPGPALGAGWTQAAGLAAAAGLCRGAAALVARRDGAARERALLRAEAALAAAPDHAHALAALVEAVGALVRPIPADVLASVETADGWLAAVAEPGAPAVHQIAPPILPGAHAADLVAGRAVQAALPADARRALGLETAFAEVTAVPIAEGGRMTGLLLVAAARRLPGNRREAIEALSRVAATALQRLAATDDLRHREAAFRALVQHSSDMLLIVGPDSRVHFQTPAVEHLLGYAASELVGRPLVDLVHPEDAPAAAAFIEQAAASPGRFGPAEWRFRRRDGSWLYAETVGTNLLGESHVGGIVLTTRDVTERKLAEAELKRRAYHDPLTHLPNRAYFMDRLQAALARGRRRGDAVAVLFVDLDGFKAVNDQLGHQAGDELLVGMATRLRQSLREQDVVARLGGDEFAVLLDRVTSPADATQAAERILARLSERVTVGRQVVPIAASIGVALGVPGIDRPDSVLRRADTALYAAKGAGKGVYVLYDEAMAAAGWERQALADELRSALVAGALTVYYQPVVVLRDGRVGEVEALIRWRHPQRGLLLPRQFLALAEETGLILPIGYWALSEACRQVRVWQRQVPSAASLTLAVNLSTRQLRDPGIAAAVEKVLRDADFDPRYLRVEVSEAVVTAHADVVAALRALQRLGVPIAIDDFGATSAALVPLTWMPFDAIKIDGRWVAALGEESPDTALLHGAIAFARARNLTVIAEGVETATQVRWLRALGIDHGQGFYFAGPLTAEAVTRRLLQQDRAGPLPDALALGGPPPAGPRAMGEG